MNSRKLSAVLRGKTLEDGTEQVYFKCPGCKHLHVLAVKRGTDYKNDTWEWDGNVDAPTFRPSIRNHTPEMKLSDGSIVPATTHCHSHVTAGVIDFLEDSAAHALRGKHAIPPIAHPEDLPPLPRLDLPTVAKPAPGAGLRKWRAAS